MVLSGSGAEGGDVRGACGGVWQMMQRRSLLYCVFRTLNTSTLLYVVGTTLQYSTRNKATKTPFRPEERVGARPAPLSFRTLSV